MKAKIEIVCPKCTKKAAFYSLTEIRYRQVVPAINGKTVCTSCGYNDNHLFSSTDYYYAIPVNTRFLYARTKEGLLSLLTYFKKNNRLHGDPEMDFPKEFYVNRLTIIKKIEKIIAEERKAISKNH